VGGYSYRTILNELPMRIADDLEAMHLRRIAKVLCQ
jgi:hypothetical protein